MPFCSGSVHSKFLFRECPIQIFVQGVSNSKQEAAAREKERELDKEQKSRRDSRRNSVLPKDLDALDDSDFFSRSSTSGFGSDLSKRETLQLLGEFWWTNFTFWWTFVILDLHQNFTFAVLIWRTFGIGAKWLWTNHHVALKVFNVYLSVRIWAAADKNNNSTTRPGPPTNESYFLPMSSSMWFRAEAILGSGVKGHFDSSTVTTRLKSLALLLVNHHLSETAEKLTFQKTENNPR